MTERELVQARWAAAAGDPLVFARYFVRTLDQHDEEQPIKPFPAYRRHIVALTRIWQGNRMMFVPKSRQLLVTWWAAMISLWDPLFHPGRLIFQQSKKLEDVIGNEHSGDGLLGRTKFIVNHIPCRDWLLPERDVEIRAKGITFLRLNSSITPIAQGGSKIRSHTVSGLVSDETAFQDEFEDAYGATVASVRRGWYLGVTTPDFKDGGCSMRIALDMPEPEVA